MSIDIDLCIKAFNLSLYLIFIYLSVQIWFVWKDLDFNGLKISSFFSESFFIRNCIYIYSFSVSIIAHAFLEETVSSVTYFKFLGVLTLLGLVLFTYDWYSILSVCASKKTMPLELIDFRCVSKKY